jgi:hypothetical protein
MNPETKLAIGLCGVFGAGLVLVAVGLGFATKIASVAVGIMLCLAAISLLNGGGRR